MKRGIAGSLIFTIFDKNPLEVLRAHTTLRYYKKPTDQIHPTALDTIDTNEFKDIYSQAETAMPFYEDQLLPFNVVIYASNEYGTRAYQVIYGIEILNAGAGISVDDITNEMQMTFVAQSIAPWQRLGSSMSDSASDAAMLTSFDRRRQTLVYSGNESLRAPSASDITVTSAQLASAAIT